MKIGNKRSKFQNILYCMFFLLVMTILLPNTVSSEIIRTSTLLPIKKAIETANIYSLVIFDVDNVVLMNTDQILQKPYKKFNNLLAKELESRHSKKKAESLWSIIMLQAEIRTVDPDIKCLINDIEARRIKTIALTKIFTGPFGNISSMVDWRIRELNKLNISFKSSFPRLKEITFKKFKPKIDNHYPVFKDGIVFTADLPKGDVLKAFLHYANFKPKMIILVDDKLDNLESVSDFCEQHQIDFKGFEYTAANNLSKSILNKKRAKYQFEILEKEHRWVNDECVPN